jgi:hypothetical protein
MKDYVKLDIPLSERLLFLFTSIISKDSVTIVTPGKRVTGSTYTHYPILPDPQGPPPSCVPDKPIPAPKPPRKKATPKPAPVRVVREKVVKEEKMPDIPFFELSSDEKVKSNL